MLVRGNVEIPHQTLTWSESLWRHNQSDLSRDRQGTFPQIVSEIRRKTRETWVKTSNPMSESRRRLTELGWKKLRATLYTIFFGPPCTVIIRKSNLIGASNLDTTSTNGVTEILFFEPPCTRCFQPTMYRLHLEVKSTVRISIRRRLTELRTCFFVATLYTMFSIHHVQS